MTTRYYAAKIELDRSQHHAQGDTVLTVSEPHVPDPSSEVLVQIRGNVSGMSKAKVLGALDDIRARVAALPNDLAG